MARIARVVVGGYPHHVTQRGNRRQRVFFREADYAAYIALMSQWCRRWRVEVWAYCLMPNHVHLVMVPESEEGLRRAVGEAHRRYTLMINRRKRWVGHLWQGRFSSFVMDEAHLLSAVRYVERNPVRARMVRKAEAYKWSSARAHVTGREDALAKVRPVLEMVGDWRGYLGDGAGDAKAQGLFGRHERTGRPLGDEEFLARVERKLGRRVRAGKRGPKGPWKKK